MEKYKCIECIDKLDAVRWLRLALQLQDWKIHIKWARLGNNGVIMTGGECMADPCYHEASITIDPEHMVDETELLFTLRHEMLHIVLAQFETYRKQVSHATSENQFDTFDEVFTLACEQTVWQMERYFDHGLGLTPRKMITKAKIEMKKGVR